MNTTWLALKKQNIWIYEEPKLITKATFAKNVQPYDRIAQPSHKPAKIEPSLTTYHQHSANA